MRTATIAALSLVISTALALSGCARANGAAPATPRTKPAEAPAPAPAPTTQDEPAVSEGWIALDPAKTGLPPGFNFAALGNKDLKAFVFIGAVPSELIHGGAIAHVKTYARRFAANGVAIEDIIPIEGADAAWVPFDMKNSEPPMSGGFAAKTSTVYPEMTIYYLLFKIVDPASPNLDADLERTQKDFVGIIRTI